MKKAQGLSLNIVIVAVIAIIVLIVIVAIFSGKARQFGAGTKNVSGGFEDVCKIQGVYGRKCMDVTRCQDKGGMVIEGIYGDCMDDSNGECCQL